MKKLVFAVTALLVATGAYATILTGPMSSGSSQAPTGFAPVVTSLSCSVVAPFATGANVLNLSGSTCTYSATCNGGACGGSDVITGWGITAQSCSGCFSINISGNVQGGANAANVTTASATVTVTATNANGTSPGVTQTIQPYWVAGLALVLGLP